ncbi:glycoside hydrolase family 55 protein, partial [Luminiphilus sp.]|nr:glycoside hydrolase family 55 protein [Luminiphilus sp.]
MSLETLVGSHVVPDFSYAGYQNGLGELPKATGTIIEVADFGALPDDAVDDSAAIQRAIDAANAVAGPVIV